MIRPTGLTVADRPVVLPVFGYNWSGARLECRVGWFHHRLIAGNRLGLIYGAWRSWLARTVWDRKVGGSSPLAPTTTYKSADLSNPSH